MGSLYLKPGLAHFSKKTIFSSPCTQRTLPFHAAFCSSPAEDDVPQNGSQVEAATVVLYGLEIVVPLMTAELLKVMLTLEDLPSLP